MKQYRFNTLHITIYKYKERAGYTGEWGSRGGPSLGLATVISMVIHVGSGGGGGGGVEGDCLLCHIDGSACGEWGSGRESRGDCL